MDKVDFVYEPTLVGSFFITLYAGREKVFDGEIKTLDVSGLFVAIGAQPVTDFLQVEGVQRKNGYVVVDDRCATGAEGLFAAGDVTNGPLKQIVTACGDGAKAGSFAAAYAGMISKGQK